MALPASGPISLLMIRTEFGGAAPDSISEYYRGGGLVPNTPVNAGIPTSGAISFSQFYNASAHTAPGINIANHSIHGIRISEPNPFPPPGTIRGNGQAQYVLLSNGIARMGESDINGNTIVTNFPGEWLTSGSNADAQVFATVSGPNAGSVSGDTFGVWLALTANRSWVLDSAVNGASATLAIQIRDAVTLAVLDSATISLSVANT